MTTTTTTIDLPQRLFDATIGTLELYAVHLGVELGLYETLDRHGPLTAPALAERAGIDARYAAEWLEQQAVAGYLHVATPGSRETRTYAFPAEFRGVLVDPLDGEHLAPFATMIAGIGGVLEDLVEAYRTGAGVPYERYGAAFRRGQGAINRPAFSADLVKEWLPEVDGVSERLAAGGRLVDLGTGLGWSAIAVKSTWPNAEVIGLDLDVASVAEARGHAAQAGVDVSFEVPADELASDLASLGPIDVVTILEALHDMARPVEVLANVRAALADGGIVVIADEAVAPTFTAPGDETERMMYGWSVTHCLPACRVHDHSLALGTVLRSATVAELAAAAGFGSCEIVDVDAGFFTIYRLTV
jgi:2-polyprenyl-3-methyl-5-hydroxy-6-metoxy-1,4-benzoquinol methylase